VDCVSAAKDNEWSDDTYLNGLFFDQFFPSVVRHAKIIDQFHADPRSPFYNTAKNDKINLRIQRLKTRTGKLSRPIL
jgi:hypothetical protein